MSSILYTTHRFGMRDRPDAQENLDTHFHHSSTTHMCTGYGFVIFSGKRASKSDFIHLFFFFSVCLLVTAAWAGGHTFSV